MWIIMPWLPNTMIFPFLFNQTESNRNIDARFLVMICIWFDRIGRRADRTKSTAISQSTVHRANLSIYDMFDTWFAISFCNHWLQTGLENLIKKLWFERRLKLKLVCFNQLAHVPIYRWCERKYLPELKRAPRRTRHRYCSVYRIPN